MYTYRQIERGIWGETGPRASVSNPYVVRVAYPGEALLICADLFEAKVKYITNVDMSAIISLIDLEMHQVA